MIYDLIVVGNGLAAQTFLFEYFRHIKSDVNKSQNYSVAQIFSEEMAPACSLKTTASVSLNGTEEGISELGNELRNSFFSFEHFCQLNHPAGVEKVRRFITSTNELETKKLIRRHQHLHPVKHLHFHQECQGVELDSYLVTPKIYGEWFNSALEKEKIVRIKDFLRSYTCLENEVISCELLGGEKILARKLILCTGAYALIFSDFYDGAAEQNSTQVVAGSFLERTVDLCLPSQYLSINGHNLIYRSRDHNLTIGSSSHQGPQFLGDYKKLSEILALFAKETDLNLGKINEYKMVTGLRHKGKQRRPVARAINSGSSVYMISGFYKNGFSFSHYFAEKMVKEIFNR